MGQAALDQFAFVKDAGRAGLSRYAELLREWQAAHNLVAPTTLPDLWTRHIADSLQLYDFVPDFEEWVDLGSGGGFPGLAVAVGCMGLKVGHVTLVESNAKKAAFLRTVIRETGANASVAAMRVETHARTMPQRADVVSARALAPLADLCGLAAPYLHENSVLLALKGQDFVHEEREASKSWSYDLLDSPSVTDPGGHVVRISKLRRRPT